jgi:predicted HTH domain antitoxin
MKGPCSARARSAIVFVTGVTGLLLNRSVRPESVSGPLYNRSEGLFVVETREVGVRMRVVQIEYPDDVLAGIDEEHLRTLAREALFVKLYEQGLLSSGRAAHLLGISRWEFLDLIGRYGVSPFDDATDLTDEVKRFI